MVESKRFADRIFDAGNAVFMVALCMVMIYPLVHVLNASLSDGYRLMAHTGLLLAPVGFSLEAHAAVFRNPNILNGFLNTFFRVGVGTVLSLLLTSMGAYILSRENVLWRGLLMKFAVFTMFFKGGLVPLYLQVKDLGLVGSRWSLVLPFAVQAYNLIIMRTYFLGIPYSLEDSGKIDGASHLTILFRIILPVAKPVVATMVLFYGVYYWNEYFYAMVFLRTRDRFPISLILREILVINETDSTMTNMGAHALKDQGMISDTIKYATTVVATVPILLVYPFLQKYFMKGVMIGSLKE